MKIRDNTIRSLKQRFHKKLSRKYPPREIDAFFYRSCEHLLALNKTELLVRMDGLLSESELLAFNAIIKRLIGMEPIQYILGYAYFYGMKLHVSPDVLIPRPETEELVELALNHIRDGQSVLDIGTGSGCIALAVKSQRKRSALSAVDVSGEALKIAGKNAKALGLSVAFSRCDILQASQGKMPGIRGPFDHVISNPPYIAPVDEAQLPENVRNHEPGLALYGGREDPVNHYKAISDICLSGLKPGGYLFLELNETLVDEIGKIFDNQYYEDINIKYDFNKKPRFLICRRSG